MNHINASAGPATGATAQPKRRLLACIAAAATLAASAVVITGSPTSGRRVTHVHGTLQIAVPGGGPSASGRGVKLTDVRLPSFVSSGTTHAALFIDGAATPAGQATSCSSTNGTGTGCTITWSAALSVPATHSFAVEIDTGATVLPHQTVLAEGKSSYSVFPGNNALGTGGNGAPLSLNGVVNTYFYSEAGCAGSSCTGNLSPADASGFTIFYAGALTTPTNGQNPTSGNVLDNNGGGANNLTFSSDTPSIGTFSGTTAAPYTSYSSGTLSILGVNSSDSFSYAVTCAAGANGKFGIVAGGAGTASGDVTSTELGNLSPVVSYPAGPSGLDSPNLFTCTNGTASNVAGSLVTN